MLKDLLCIVEGGDKPSPALFQSLAMVRAYKVSPLFVAAVPGPPPLSTIFGADLVEALITKANSEAANTAQLVSAQIIELSRRQGCDPKVIEECRPLARVLKELEEHARNYDLTVLARPDWPMDVSSAIFERILFGSGQPVLLANSRDTYTEHFKTAVLAWDGSNWASRALASAISLFPDLKEIFILTVVGEKNLGDLVPGAGIAAHIRRHGIKSTVSCVDLQAGEDNAGPAIAKYAGDVNADLVVMGAYSHARLREFILGGVTEFMSKQATFPLLLSH
jgi:nucleotide-binding universal stress UspA family protein